MRSITKSTLHVLHHDSHYDSLVHGEVFSHVFVNRYNMICFSAAYLYNIGNEMCITMLFNG